jgi:hypothetical protein
MLNDLSQFGFVFQLVFGLLFSLENTNTGTYSSKQGDSCKTDDLVLLKELLFEIQRSENRVKSGRMSKVGFVSTYHKVVMGSLLLHDSFCSFYFN